MVRFGSFVASLILVGMLAPSLLAQPGEAPVSQTLAMQKAMATGRVLLEQNRGREAVEILQKELLHANGNAKYLSLLRDAYALHLKELQLNKAPAEQVEQISRQLAILDRDGKPATQVVAAPPAALAPPEPVQPVAANPTLPIKIETEPASVKVVEDPFQQVPLDRSKTPEKTPQVDSRALALTAFQQKKFAEANRLFKQLPREVELNSEERTAWGYSRLHEVSTQLNQSGDKAVPVSVLEQETQQAMQLGGEKLQAWGKQVLGELAKRQKAAPANAPTSIPEGWQVMETANFRIIHKQMKDLASEVARGAELARTGMYERWVGPTSGNWKTKCDIWLHPAGADYTQATHQSATSPGHTTVTIRNNTVIACRMDLRADVAELTDAVLPHEVTYVVLHELFADQPIPRWAEVAMTVMSEPPSQVARYLRSVPRLVQEKRILPFNKLLNSTDFPDEASATPFFVESVSVVDYLVRLRGAKAFALFLREAPRRGIDKSLSTHYGFKDANDLQEKWLKYASAQ